MSDLTITTDRKWKFFYSVSDVPAKVLADQFGYQNRDEVFDGFIKYRDYWYHADMFMRIDHTDVFNGWHGYHSDSAFSGVLIKISGDGEKYMIGTYCS